MNKETEKEWSITIPSTLLRCKSLTDSLKLTIGYLKLRSGIESWVTSATDIANHVGCSHQTGTKNIAYLMRHGALMTAGTKQTTLKSGKPYEYKVFSINRECLRKLIETPPIEAKPKRQCRSLRSNLDHSKPLRSNLDARRELSTVLYVPNNNILGSKIAVSEPGVGRNPPNSPPKYQLPPEVQKRIDDYKAGLPSSMITFTIPARR